MPSVRIHPLVAAAHVHPYPYYAALRNEAPVFFDMEHKIWVVSRADLIMQLMQSPHCVVRPPKEPVPAAIVGTPAAEIFARLIRMNEGQAHLPLKQAIQCSLARLDTACLPQLVKKWRSAECDLYALCHFVPVAVLADLLGFAPDTRPELMGWIADFVACLSPLSSEADLAGASVAAQCLLAHFTLLLEGDLAQGSVLANLVQDSEGADRQALLANLIGLLSQSYEATAGLLGNCLIALQQHGMSNDLPLTSFVEEVARFDPSVQNTRRFVVQDLEIHGQQLRKGDAVLLLLAAANRDAAFNAKGDDFAQGRTDRRSLSFGHGRHSCPGQTLAIKITTAILSDYLAQEGMADPLQWRYQASANGRIPRFFSHQEKAI
ncbi:cytochrome P450 [Iodobacter fluviatilis]|uniref:Cytochrome P450 n=1 Tax=Iodobacter fluviatilis TaxID=537 RepID=A0A377SSX0_9NEIS|nr:cytochrome P450 [Iodobacter fluviatilis]TCU82237.1 cytochrome P450 [Iodobacter fluviatilis]STR45132.1 Biotin biosynthesis cytochrome P450 [Iodobacter fluviatilis]